jgi:flavin-dependent dehydrogenase
LFLVTRKGDIAYTDRSTDTDFITRGGPNNYAYNVIRSEADELLFRHAAESGAHTFDGFKVTSVNFTPSPYLQNADPEFKTSNAGLPESVNWTSKTGISGITTCKYLVDASGRHGLLSTKYLRNRRMNSGSHLQSVATWAYWTNGGVYAQGTEREGYPYFEALVDGSGWVWFIPLHNGQWSVGVVRNRNVLAEKKGEGGGDRAVYLDALHGNPGINELLCRAEMVSEIRSASDWSYSAESYASPYIRIVGDAGCFVDPFFSSGVHLALNSGLSAATTICASIKGQVPEGAAARWHSKRVEESYTRFLVVVSSALKQIIEQESAVLVEEDEKSFEKAFQQFRPGMSSSSWFY